jgi:hypothetical protein
LLDDSLFGLEYHFGVKALPKEKSGLFFLYTFASERASMRRRIHCTLAIDFGVAIPLKNTPLDFFLLGDGDEREAMTMLYMKDHI